MSDDTLYLGNVGGAATDYRQPFVRATLVIPSKGKPVEDQGRRYPLWTNLNLSPQEQEDAELWNDSNNQPIDALPYLQDLTIEMQAAYLPIIKARLNFPYREGIAFLNSKLIEWGYSNLEVVLGYTGGSPDGPVLAGENSTSITSPTFIGTILVPEIDIGSQVAITLNAQGVGGFAAAGTTRAGGPYSGRRRDVLEIFAKGPNEKMPRDLKIDFSKIDPPANAIDSEVVKKWNEEVKDVSPAGKTDWIMIQELVSNAACWMTLIGNTLVITPKNSFSDPVTRIFTLFEHNGGDMSSGTGHYPIISCNSTAPAIYAPSSTLGLWGGDVDSTDPAVVSKTVFNHKNNPQNASGEGNVGPASTPNSASVSATAEDIDNGNQDGYGFFAGGGNTPLWVDQMRKIHRAKSGNIGIKLNINTIGIPDILPLENITVKGLGQRMDNVNYKVLKVTHSIGTSGFTTYLECFCNVQGHVADYLNPPKTKAATSVISAEQIDRAIADRHTLIEVQSERKPAKTQRDIEDANKLLKDIDKRNKKQFPNLTANENKLAAKLKKGSKLTESEFARVTKGLTVF